MDLNQGRYPSAERRARSLLETALGDDRVSAVKIGLYQHQLGRALGLQQRFAEAEPMFRRAVETRTTALSDSHMLTIESNRMLGWTLRSLERYDEALMVYRDCASTLSQTVGAHDWRTIRARNAVVTVLRLSGDLDAAEREGLEVATLARAALPGDHGQVRRAVRSVIVIYEDRLQHDPGNQSHQQALNQWQQVLQSLTEGAE